MLEETIKSGKITEAMNFNQKVWAIAARIPRGKVVTYGDIARVLGTRAYRAVGNALNRNPYAPAVPCHRVVGSDGSLTGFAAGVAMKKRLLVEDGIRFATVDKVDLNGVRYELRAERPSAATIRQIETNLRGINLSGING